MPFHRPRQQMAQRLYRFELRLRSALRVFGGGHRQEMRCKRRPQVRIDSPPPRRPKRALFSGPERSEGTAENDLRPILGRGARMREFPITTYR